MKYSILQKVTLTAMALAVSFALSAQAGTPRLSTAKQAHHITSDTARLFLSAKQAGTGQQSPMEFIYLLDDGTAENSIGLTGGGDVIALNEFTSEAGAETIQSIEIAWGTPVIPDPSLNGLPYTVAIWSDPNGDGNPNDAVLLTTASEVVASEGTDTFISTDIPDTTIPTGANFFVGFLITNGDGQFPAAFDETAPIFNRSYIAGGDAGTGDINDLNNNGLPVAPIESFGLLGNWLIRATAGGGGGGITLTATVNQQNGMSRVNLSWSPANGGDMNILRNGVIITTTPDDGFARKNVGTHTGTTTFQVCETDTGDCSNVLEVTVP